MTLAQMRRSLVEDQLERRTDVRAQEMTPVGGPVGAPHHDMSVNGGLIVLERDVTSERQHLDLLAQRDLAVSLRLPVNQPSVTSLRAPIAVNRAALILCSRHHAVKVVTTSSPLAKTSAIMRPCSPCDSSRHCILTTSIHSG
jgi:hypothetical protein